MRTSVRALVAVLLFAALTGLVYPAVMTGIAQVTFHHKAEGSLVTVNGRTVGSSLIGQDWNGPQWFYGRPSAVKYDASTSGGSNQGPTSAQLADDIQKRAQAIVALEGPYVPGLTIASIPVELLTASGSGLDPDISVAGADLQAPRIAAARGLQPQQVIDLIRAHTQAATLGFLGEKRVNVLDLNLALQRLGS
ncbi:MAG: potassium-transporting ATPase subunit KdpC [Actinomycetota bacterium]